jgi:hypothetical protein
MTSEYLSFSQQLQYEKSMNITSVVIYPRKGEVWAVFNDWDIHWNSEAENPKEFNSNTRLWKWFLNFPRMMAAKSLIWKK